MNAVVLTAVLSCLNSGMYTASRMLFVLAARREAPAQLVAVTRRGVPAAAILASSVVGFLCVIAAAVSPDTIFAFLLNSSGAIILFVYLLIAISQIVLRYRTADSKLRVKMWLFPVLSILTALAIVAILVQMGIQDGRAVAAGAEPAVVGGGAGVLLRQQVVHRSSPGAGGGRPRRRSRTGCWCWPTRPPTPASCSMSCVASARTRAAKYFVVVPASPIETGVAATHGPLDVAEATQEAAQQRLDYTLTTLRSENLDADGALGDYRPLRALANAVDDVPSGSDRDRDVAAGVFGVAPLRRGGPGPRRVRRAGDARRGHPGRGGAERAMTIIAAFSASRQGSAPLNLAAQISRTTGDKIIAAAIVERPWPPRDDPVEDEYLRLRHVEQAQQSLEQVVEQAARRSRHLRRRPPIDLDPNGFDGSCRRAQQPISWWSGRRRPDCWAGSRWAA